MYPNIVAGDSILVSKVMRIPKRGDTIAFRYSQKEYVKRVIGLAGDTIEVRDNVIIVNGKALNEQITTDPCTIEPDCKLQRELLDGSVYAIAVSATPSSFASVPAQRVESGHVFLLGDNRDWSYDSRQFGAIPIGDIVGYVEYLWWPPSRYGAFPRAR
jgi:signal peptidase I